MNSLEESLDPRGVRERLRGTNASKFHLHILYSLLLAQLVSLLQKASNIRMSLQRSKIPLQAKEIAPIPIGREVGEDIVDTAGSEGGLERAGEVRGDHFCGVGSWGARFGGERGSSGARRWGQVVRCDGCLGYVCDHGENVFKFESSVCDKEEE